MGALSMTASRPTGWIWGSAIVFLFAALILPWIGGSIGIDRVLAKAAPDYPIFVELRVSRTLLGLLAGGALSLTGCLFQSMLREFPERAQRTVIMSSAMFLPAHAGTEFFSR